MRNTKTNEISDWISVFFDPDGNFINEITEDWERHRINLIEKSAEYFHNDIRRSHQISTSPFSLDREFSKLTKEERSPWYDFVSGIPAKLKSLDLRIRPYKEFCRTCLILQDDLENFARSDYERYYQKYKSDINKFVPFAELHELQRRFYSDINHLIPPILKKIGYELVRPAEISEISENMVRKFARAIHSRYLHEIKRQNPVSEKIKYWPWIHSAGYPDEQYTVNFEDLPEDIRNSNLDNAYHIPAKLLAIGYKIRPVRKGFEPSALHLSEDDIEIMARVEHVRWCWDKIMNGWMLGETKDSKNKFHPSIIPYEDLQESEKEKDRELVRLIPSLLKDIGYEAFPVNPEKICKLPYAVKPHSSIHKLLDETRKMNRQIRNMVTLSPEVEKMVNARNTKIEEAIKEIESSYYYAQHIQKTFLPDNLYIRECFPDSFVLFKPKDIVSGDFYFFSRQGDLIFFAAADCTGHGIPGALLSIIGYGILDQAINELKLSDPQRILNHLYSHIHRFMRHDEERNQHYDDLDIALCSFNPVIPEINYAGVGAPLYHLSEKGLFEYKPQNTTDEVCEDNRYSFVSERIRVKQGDTIYLFSDGYIDQFGGKFHKKYQSGRFKDLLLAIYNQPMPEQSDRLYEEFERWRGENDEDQTDDILIAGIRV